MKYAKALAIINKSKGTENTCTTGFRVSFEQTCGGLRTSDYFPALDEEPIPKEEAAWDLARMFAEADKTVRNVYVITSDTFSPVPGYKTKKLNAGTTEPTIDIDVFNDHVLWEGQRINKPSWWSVTNWTRYWEHKQN